VKVNLNLTSMDSNAQVDIEIFISAKKLPNKDTFSKSDPFCVLDLWDVKQSTWKRIGQSETVQDNLSPSFDKEFVVTYFFEEQQKLRASLYDSDAKLQDEKHSELLGRSEFVLADLVSAQGQTLHLPLMKDNGKCAKKDCVVTVQGEEITHKKAAPPVVDDEPPVKMLESITMSFRAEKLDKKDFFGKSDP
jgi:Ca2+-dependent lipid-binding protein